MGPRGFDLVRLHGRYCAVFHQFDGHPEVLGANIVAKTPTDPQEYKGWLEEQRLIHAEKEKLLEDNILTIRDSALPEELGLGEIHQIPAAIPDDCIAEPAIAAQASDDFCQSYERKFWSLSPRLVEPKLSLNRGQVFLGLSLVNLYRQYEEPLTSFALEWSPDDFIFRELAFAIISLASGQVRFHSFPQRDCNPDVCIRFNCPNGHGVSKGRLVIPNSGLGVGGSDILPEFGYSCHRPDDAPGAAPIGTMYWFEEVLISIALINGANCEEVIVRAVEFGIDQGRESFQVVIMSLFHFILVDVDARDGKINIAHTELMGFSPIQIRDCHSTDPRKRPGARPGDKFRPSPSLATLHSAKTYQSPEDLCKRFPGFVSLLNFFHIAANRRANSHSRSRVPPEICYQILEYTDDITYLACAKVSRMFRMYCQQNFRAGRFKITSEPWSDQMIDRTKLRHVMAFEFVSLQTSAVTQLHVLPSVDKSYKYEHNWSPIIGIDRPVILKDVSLYFEPVNDESNED